MAAMAEKNHDKDVVVTRKDRIGGMRKEMMQNLSLVRRSFFLELKSPSIELL